MTLRLSRENSVEVDMVPLIDIVSLLLMFLVMVGDMTRSASAVKMSLPRADQAQKDLAVNTENRIVVQLRKEGGVWSAVINNMIYELVERGRNQSLTQYLEDRVRLGGPLQADGSSPVPVKLRIPKDAPMREVECVVMNLAAAKLTNVCYAAEKEPVRN